MRRTPIRKALIATALLLTGAAQAALLTSNSLVGATTIDFSDQAAQSGVFGAVQIGALVGQDVTVASSSNSNGLYFNYNGWGMLENGNWGNGRSYVSLNGSTDSMVFAFNDGPVSSVGGLMSYARSISFAQPLVISAYDSGMNLLEAYDVTALADIIEPEFNGDAFRGISRNSADISYFVISGGLANALDDLSFVSGANAVPEPAGLALVGLALAAGAAVRRKRA